MKIKRYSRSCYPECAKKWIEAGMSAPFFLFLFSIFLVATVFTCQAAGGSDPVTAGFVKKNGNDMVVRIKAAKPVPASIIFTMKLPQGIKLERSQPQPGKYDSGKGEVKWLLRGLSPGTHDITLKFSGKVDSAALHAEIRYLNSSTGKLSVLPVK